MLRLGKFFGDRSVPYSFVTTPGQYLIAPGFNPYPQDPYRGARSGGGASSGQDQYDGLTAYYRKRIGEMELQSSISESNAKFYQEKANSVTDPEEQKKYQNLVVQEKLKSGLIKQQIPFIYSGNKLATKSVMDSLDVSGVEGDRVAIFRDNSGRYRPFISNGRIMTMNDYKTSFLNDDESPVYDGKTVIQPYSNKGIDGSQVIQNAVDRAAKIFNSSDAPVNDARGNPIQRNVMFGEQTASLYGQWAQKSNNEALDLMTNAMIAHKDDFFSPEEMANFYREYYGTNRVLTQKDAKGNTYEVPAGRLRLVKAADMTGLSDAEKQELYKLSYYDANVRGIEKPKGTQYYDEELSNGKKVKVFQGQKEETFDEYLSARVLSNINPFYMQDTSLDYKTLSGNGAEKADYGDGTYFRKQWDNLHNMEMGMEKTVGYSVSTLPATDKQSKEKQEDMNVARAYEEKMLRDNISSWGLGKIDKQNVEEIINIARTKGVLPSTVISNSKELFGKAVDKATWSPVLSRLMVKGIGDSVYNRYANLARGKRTWDNLEGHYLSPTVKYSFYEEAYNPPAPESDATRMVYVPQNITLFTKGIDVGETINTSNIGGGVFIGDVRKLYSGVPTVVGKNSDGTPIFGDNQDRGESFVIMSKNDWKKKYPDGIYRDNGTEKIYLLNDNGTVNTKILEDKSMCMEMSAKNYYDANKDRIDLNDNQKKALAAFYEKNKDEDLVGLWLMTDLVWAKQNDAALHPQKDDKWNKHREVLTTR